MFPDSSQHHSPAPSHQSPPHPKQSPQELILLIKKQKLLFKGKALLPAWELQTLEKSLSTC